MPTYEYRCPDGHHFELFQKMSDEPVARCPECGAESERLLSGGAGFLFKGDGFYITDSRSDSYKNEASKEQSGGKEEKASVPAKKAEGKAVAEKPESPATPSNDSNSTGS